MVVGGGLAASVVASVTGAAPAAAALSFFFPKENIDFLLAGGDGADATGAARQTRKVGEAAGADRLLRPARGVPGGHQQDEAPRCRGAGRGEAVYSHTQHVLSLKLRLGLEENTCVS